MRSRSPASTRTLPRAGSRLRRPPRTSVMRPQRPDSPPAAPGAQLMQPESKSTEKKEAGGSKPEAPPPMADDLGLLMDMDKPKD